MKLTVLNLFGIGIFISILFSAYIALGNLLMLRNGTRILPGFLLFLPYYFLPLLDLIIVPLLFIEIHFKYREKRYNH